MADLIDRADPIDRDGYGIGRNSTPGFRFAPVKRNGRNAKATGDWAGDPATTPGRTLALLRRGRAWHVRDLCDALWGDREDGGPLHAATQIRVQMHRLRQIWGWPIETLRDKVYRLDPQKVTALTGQMHWPVGLTVAVWYPGHALHGKACFVTGRSQRLQFEKLAGSGYGRRIGLKGAPPVLDLGLQVPCRAIQWRDPQETGAVFAMAPAELRVMPPQATAYDLRQLLRAAEAEAEAEAEAGAGAGAEQVSRETCGDEDAREEEAC